MNKILVFATTIFLISCGNHHSGNTAVIIKTNMGNVEVELFPKQAPKSVAAFLSYVDSGFYNNSSFYRVLKNEDMQPQYNSGLIQGGIWKTNNSKVLSLPGIEHESPAKTGMTHSNGTISLARTKPGTASSEFFICIGDQRQFDQSTSTNDDGLGFAAFGRVTKGMDVVRKIQAQSSSGEEFSEPVIIKTIERDQ